MCSIRIIKKVPDLAENFVNTAASLLKEKHHGVLLTGIQLCTDLCNVSTEALEYFRKVYLYLKIPCPLIVYEIICMLIIKYPVTISEDAITLQDTSVFVQLCLYTIVASRYFWAICFSLI